MFDASGLVRQEADCGIPSVVRDSSTGDIVRWLASNPIEEQRIGPQVREAIAELMRERKINEVMTGFYSPA